MVVKKEKNNVNNAKETKDRNEELKKYESIVSIWRRWDESYWTSFYVFIIVIGLLLAGYSQTVYNKFIGFPLVYCIVGIIITIIWLFILHRKLVHIYIAEYIGRNVEEKINSDSKLGCFMASNEFKKRIKDKEPQTKNELKKLEEELEGKFENRIKYTKRSSGYLVSYIFPLIIIAIWILFLIVTLIYKFGYYFCMCVDTLTPIGLFFNLVGIIILLIPQIFVKTRPLTPGESQFSIARKEERRKTILGLIFVLTGFILQFIAQF